MVQWLAIMESVSNGVGSNRDVSDIFMGPSCPPSSKWVAKASSGLVEVKAAWKAMANYHIVPYCRVQLRIVHLVPLRSIKKRARDSLYFTYIRA